MSEEKTLYQMPLFPDKTHTHTITLRETEHIYVYVSDHAKHWEIHVHTAYRIVKSSSID